MITLSVNISYGIIVCIDSRVDDMDDDNGTDDVDFFWLQRHHCLIIDRKMLTAESVSVYN